jgi:hypothetical protein
MYCKIGQLGREFKEAVVSGIVDCNNREDWEVVVAAK